MRPKTMAWRLWPGPLGGYIVTYADWRWILNVPVGIVAFVATSLLVPDLRPGRSHSLDPVGVDAKRGAPTLCREQRGDERQHLGHEERAARALDDTSRDELGGVRRQTAGCRGRG